MNVNPLALTLVMATVCVLVSTPFVAKIMWRWRVLDIPDGVRKLHGRVVPLAGGVGVLWGWLLATAVTVWVFPHLMSGHSEPLPFLSGLACACVWICILGIVDDSGHLRGRQKIIAQLVAALILTSSGCVISRLEFLDVHLELGVLSLPFTVFWLIGSINAVNLIDGIDGLATSVGVILSGTFALMALITGHRLEAVLAVALCGALMGLLPYNFPRARIFLGDTGSMLIGLLLGTLALRCSVKSQATLTLVAPVAVLSVLIFDVGMAILRRKLTGRSLYSTDRGHLHNRLTQLGFTPMGVVLFVCSACTLCSAGALASLFYRNEWIALSVASTVIFSCVLAKVFGHTEFHLLLNRMQEFMRSIFRFSKPSDTPGAMTVMQIQGHLDWTPIWRNLRRVAQTGDLILVELHINAPFVHECYHAEWSRRTVATERQWLTCVPVFHQGEIMGRISIRGELRVSGSGSSAEQIAEFVQGLVPIESQINQLLSPATLPCSGVVPEIAA